LRSGTSVGANYRAAGGSRSKAEFVSKIAVVVEEADETVFWLELLHEGGIVSSERLPELSREADELASLGPGGQRGANVTTDMPRFGLT